MNYKDLNECKLQVKKFGRVTQEDKATRWKQEP